MLPQQIINGIMLGSIYALIAIGYNLILGILNMLNLAHGDVFMWGAFLGLMLVQMNIPFIFAIILAVIGAGLISVLVERLCFNPLKEAHILAPLVSTIAFGMILQNSAVQIWGSQPSPFPREFLESASLDFGSVTLSTIEIAVVLLAIGLMIGIDLIVKKTQVGRAIRAVSEDPVSASLMGINKRMTVVVTFFIAGALAGAAGVLVFLIFGQMAPFTGFKLGLIAMVAIVIGGMGSIRGAMVGGLILGFVEVMNAAYFMGSIRDIIFFGVMLLFITLRPQGLFGKRVGEV